MAQVLHSNEKEQFRKLFQRDKIDRFEERFSIMEFFLQIEKHVTSLEFLDLLHAKKIKIGSKLVVDTLKLMCRYGFARKHQFENGETRYEHMHLGQHHDHMICVKCGKIFEFEDDNLEKLQMKIASAHGFYALQHKMELYGICSECMIDHEKMLCLAEASQGERLCITGFSEGKRCMSRLSSVGLRIGDEVDIIVNAGKGQLVIALGHKRLVLCRRLANNLLVTTKARDKSRKNFFIL